MREKLNEFISILTQKKVIKFYLYNVIYVVYCRKKKYIIRQLNSNLEYVYDDLQSLFVNYTIYGQSIAECFDNLILIAN